MSKGTFSIFVSYYLVKINSFRRVSSTFFVKNLTSKHVSWELSRAEINFFSGARSCSRWCHSRHAELRKWESFSKRAAYVAISARFFVLYDAAREIRKRGKREVGIRCLALDRLTPRMREKRKRKRKRERERERAQRRKIRLANSSFTMRLTWI